MTQAKRHHDEKSVKEALTNLIYHLKGGVLKFINIFIFHMENYISD